MSYMTWEHLAAKYPGAGAKFGNSPEVALVFLPGAQAEIDGRLAAKYSVPFSPVPALITDLCVDLVYIKLTIREPKLSKAVKDYYDERMKGLMDGSILLVDQTGTTLVNGDNVAVIDKEYHTSFGPDKVINWQTDSDAICNAYEVRLDD